MLADWKLFNFKSVKPETLLPIGPLTLLSGINSSGKSSLIQSMLLVAQTLGSSIGSRSVVLNGQYVRLGQFDELRSFGAEADQILIGFTIQPHPLDGRTPAKEYTCEFSFDTRGAGASAEMQQLQPGLFSFSLFTRDEQTGAEHRITASRSSQPFVTQSDEIKPPVGVTEVEFRESLNYQVSLDKLHLVDLARGLHVSSVELVGCLFRHFLPTKLLVRFNVAEQQAHRYAEAIVDAAIAGWTSREEFNPEQVPLPVLGFLEGHLGADYPSLFELLPGTGLPFSEWRARVQDVPRADVLWTKLRRLEGDVYALWLQTLEPKQTVGTVALPPVFATLIEHMGAYFTRSVRYLGPLRDEPKPVYPLAITALPTDVGLRGEHTAAVLERFKDQVISYISPEQFSGTGPLIPYPESRSLLAAVREWLRYLEVVEDVATQNRGKFGVEMKVTTAGTSVLHDLTHVGVGVSQVLPIVVSCLLAEPGTTLIFEQPELHLHGRVQALLGDFFLSMALLGKQCILETHSEYLVSRLRYRAAAAPIDDEIAKHMKLYFVQKTDGVSAFTDMEVNSFGAVVDWPEGFFDQGQLESERILRASLLKRKALQQKEKPHD